MDKPCRECSERVLHVTTVHRACGIPSNSQALHEPNFNRKVAQPEHPMSWHHDDHACRRNVESKPQQALHCACCTDTTGSALMACAQQRCHSGPIHKIQQHTDYRDGAKSAQVEVGLVATGYEHFHNFEVRRQPTIPTSAASSPSRPFTCTILSVVGGVNSRKLCSDCADDTPDSGADIDFHVDALRRLISSLSFFASTSWQRQLV